jgi:hypothetical protein
MHSLPFSLLLLVLLLLCFGTATVTMAQKIGYDDTPLLPESEWRVHDSKRPRPVVVTPGPFAALPRPDDAVVLFDGKNLDAWTANGGPARWVVEGEDLVVSPSGDIQTQDHFGDIQLHVEWAAPKEVKGDSQGRGNSGIFLMGRYEVQVLDSYENPTYADGQAAALYGQRPPDVNVCRPPGEWQTYDIFFRAPRFTDGKLQAPAVITVVHNGVVVHHAHPLLGTTSHKALPKYVAHDPKGPIRLQDHGNPVRYRNIWCRELH